MKTAVLLITISLFILILSGCRYDYMPGYYSLQEFEQKTEWKKVVDEKYEPKGSWGDSLAKIKEPFSVDVVLNTNCRESRKFVPGFFNLAADLPVDQMQIIAVDSTKRDEKGFCEQHNIKKVPTFIFYRQGKEIGRIIEKPDGRLERHMYRILK